MFILWHFKHFEWLNIVMVIEATSEHWTYRAQIHPFHSTLSTQILLCTHLWTKCNRSWENHVSRCVSVNRSTRVTVRVLTYKKRYIEKIEHMFTWFQWRHHVLSPQLVANGETNENMCTRGDCVRIGWATEGVLLCKVIKDRSKRG